MHSSLFTKSTHFIFVSILLLYFINMPANAEVVRYRQAESDLDKRVDYPIDMLKLSLSKVDPSIKAIPTKTRMQQGRALKQLAKGLDVDVVWSGTTKEREKSLLAIRIPLQKGLNGYRLLLIKKEDQDKFAKAYSLEEFKQFSVVQGHDWPEVSLLKHNGFRVVGVSQYDASFAMLLKGRVDAYPRSLTEIWAEAASYKKQGLIIEPSKILVYPQAFYFFVNKSNERLARLIETGLKKAYQDGSFDKLFNQYYAGYIKKAKLDSRQVYRLRNEQLPISTPLTQDELWLPPLF